MRNGILKLDWASIGDAALTAVTISVVAGLYSVVTNTGFNIFSTDWVMVTQNMINWAFVAAVVSIGKDLLSDNQGNVLGIKTN